MKKNVLFHWPPFPVQYQKHIAKPIRMSSIPNPIQNSRHLRQKPLQTRSVWKSRRGNAPDWTWKMQPSIACNKLKVIERDQTLSLAYPHSGWGKQKKKKKKLNVEKQQAAQSGESTANKHLIGFKLREIDRGSPFVLQQFCQFSYWCQKKQQGNMNLWHGALYPKQNPKRPAQTLNRYWHYILN